MEAEEEAPSTRRQFVKNAAGAAAAAAVAGYVAWPATSRARRKGRTPVRLWHLLGAEWLEPVERAVARFNDSQSRYEVLPLLLAGSEADSKLLLSVAGGDPPDVMLIWTQGTSVWGQSGLLQPLDRFMTGEEQHRFLTEAYPVVRKSGWYQGHLYGITMGFDLFVCYYRPDHFRQAGLDPDHFPTTLEELVVIGNKLNRFDPGHHITRLGFLPQTFENYVASFGGGFYDEKSGQVTLNTPENLGALEFLVETRKRLGLNEVIRFQSGLSSDSGASWPFISGTYSVTVDGEWRVEQMRRYAPALEYRTVPLPPPAGGKSLASFSMINYLVIPTGARNADGAWEFIKFWTGLDNPEQAAEFFPWYGWMPLFPKSAKAPTYEKWLQTVPQYRTFLRVAESENIVTSPPVPYQLYLMDRISRADDLAMRGTLTPRRALEQLEADVARERARRKDWVMRNSGPFGLSPIQRLLAYLALIALSILPLLPLVWMVSSSLKTDRQIFPAEGQSAAAVTLARLIPHPVQWSNYPHALSAIPFLTYLKNTLFLCMVTVVGTVFSSALVAYGFARLEFKGKQPLFLLMIATMILPDQVTMIPVFALFRWLRWYGTYLPLTAPSFFGSAFYIFLLTQFYRTLPEDLSEAARVDGASEWRIFWQIILPLSKPALATCALFQFLATWNDFFGPLLYLNDSSRYTLAYGLQQFLSSHGGEWSHLMAAATLFTLPVIILFFFAQRTFIQGIATTGGKN